ncbi:MAG: Rpp14/Pop5 family protein [Nanoarchaeota archaeon]|nr:Rpp14/Pop5 family protein [Nanoarchaeota archaeon]
MKSLKPSMREKKRYLLVVGKNLRENIRKAISEFSGAQGMAKTCLNFIDEKKDSAIISVNRESVNLVRASLVVYPEKMEVLRVSGTLKGLKKR